MLPAKTNEIGFYFSKILEGYNYARHNLEFGGNHEIREYFEKLKALLAAAPVVEKRTRIHIACSYGKGNWATTLAVFPRHIRDNKHAAGNVRCVPLPRGRGRLLYQACAGGN